MLLQQLSGSGCHGKAFCVSLKDCAQVIMQLTSPASPNCMCAQEADCTSAFMARL